MLSLLLIALPLLAPSDDWLQWRGPGRQAVVEGPAWPADLSAEHLTLRWRLPDLGPSYSGTLVLGDLVITTESRDEAFEAVVGLDRATGDRRWRVEWPCEIEVAEIGRRNGTWIRATPASDGETVFVGGMRDLVVAVDVESGEVRWRADLLERFGTPSPQFGLVSSPLVHEGAVYVQAALGFCKLDAATGEVLWRVLEDSDGKESAFACPIVATLGGREQLVVQMRKTLAGVSPAGEVLWRLPVEADYGTVVVTPTPVGERVFIGPYGKRSRLIEVGATAEGWTTSEAWQARSSGYMSTPVLLGEHLYFYTQANRFTCLDARDGSTTWTSPPTEDSYWSLVGRGDRILALAQDGVLRLLAADPGEYRVLDEVTLSDEETWAHLTVAGQELLVREQGALACYDWR